MSRLVRVILLEVMKFDPVLFIRYQAGACRLRPLEFSRACTRKGTRTNLEHLQPGAPLLASVSLSSGHCMGAHWARLQFVPTGSEFYLYKTYVLI